MQIPFKLKNETIYLCCDDNNYTLARDRERKRDGVTVTELEDFKWFSSIGAAFNKIMEMKVKESDARTLLELKQAIESAKDEVNSVWNVPAPAGRAGQKGGAI